MPLHYPKVTTLLIFTTLAGFCYGQSSSKPDSSRRLRIAKVMDVSADVEPTMDSLRHGVGRFWTVNCPKMVGGPPGLPGIKRPSGHIRFGKGENWCNTHLFSGVGEG